MKDRNLVNSFSERIKKKVGGWNSKAVQRASYSAVFILVLALVATSYTNADSNTQVNLPGATASDNINVNLLQGQKIDQIATANSVAASVATTSGGIASGAATAGTTPATATTAGDVKAANVASSVASVVNLSSSSSVSSSAESANVSAEMAQADATSVSKQQIVEPTVESKTLINYTAQEGDNAATIGDKYGISAQTVRWANGLKDDNVTPGANLVIPTIDGVVYTVKDGDTLASIAEKYGSNADNIVNVNNLSNDTVATGMQLLLPDGTLPETERPEYVAPVPQTTVRRTTTATTTSTSTFYASGSGRANVRSAGMYVPATSGNTYAYGYCTWYAYNRRVQLGLPVAARWGNANTWATSAARAGYTVNRTPSVGAIFQTTAGYYGHVGIVEAINADGSIHVSEMNYAGWNVLTVGDIPASQVGNYNYIH